MIEEEIVFVTTTLYTKWLNYQKDIIKKLFPKSDHLIINGTRNWPISWFYWIDEVKKSNKKYYIHIDEDFFITSKSELIKVIEKMKSENIDLMGCSDGFNHYRSANPVAMNTFLMFGKVEHIKKIDNYSNLFKNRFNESYKKDFEYKFKKQGGFNFEVEQEPYYVFFWEMKNKGCKFDYLYPFFDERFKSTNPRLNENSDDIGIHMWYSRQWNSNMNVWGLKNKERYYKVEEYITNFLKKI